MARKSVDFRSAFNRWPDMEAVLGEIIPVSPLLFRSSMAFIRRRGEVESYRDELGRPRQRVLACLGDRAPRGPHKRLRGSVKVSPKGGRK